ncbi:hypothetical protein pb186bvf_017713 [Paramecium bursaria]
MLARYQIKPGNNSQLIQGYFTFKPDWMESQYLPDFLWSQTDAKHDYRHNMLFNHIQNHHQLTQKANLIRNLTRYCQKHKAYIWEITPVTFIINTQTPIDIDLTKKDFLEFYHNKPLTKKYCVYTKPKIKDGNEENLWICKPSSLNRGQGVQLFKTEAELNKIICRQDKKSLNQDFIVQKYIENPLLIDSRKFDIRMYVLITQDLDIYVFEQGYLRLSSEKFDLKNTNTFIHLTNNAIQKQGEKYCLFEEGNQLSFQFLNEMTQFQFEEKSLAKIKQIIVVSLLSVQHFFHKSKGNFEILGYDFMVDQNLKPWLIEINTNPCLDESSPLLKDLIPRMINQALDIVLLKKVDPKQDWQHLLRL